MNELHSLNSNSVSGIVKLQRNEETLMTAAEKMAWKPLLVISSDRIYIEKINASHGWYIKNRIARKQKNRSHRHRST